MVHLDPQQNNEPGCQKAISHLII